MEDYGIFGCTAILAAEKIKQGLTPKEAWEAALEKIEKKSMRDKGCPKGAFLALFSETDGKYKKHNYYKNNWSGA